MLQGNCPRDCSSGGHGGNGNSAGRWQQEHCIEARRQRQTGRRAEASRQAVPCLQEAVACDRCGLLAPSLLMPLSLVQWLQVWPLLPACSEVPVSVYELECILNVALAPHQNISELLRVLVAPFLELSKSANVPETWLCLYQLGPWWGRPSWLPGSALPPWESVPTTQVLRWAMPPAQTSGVV